MRSGKIKNPQLNTLRALCQFFHIPLRYFETGTREECYAILTTPSVNKQPALNEIAFRASGLPPQAQQDILSLIKVFQEEEKQRLNNPDLPLSTSLEDDEDPSSDGA